MELSKFMKHKECEVVTLLTLILGGGKVFIRKSKLVKKVVAAQRFFLLKALHIAAYVDRQN